MAPSSNSTHQGKVVSVSGNRVTSICDKGEQHVHSVGKDTRVTCDGHDSKVAELKSGDAIRVTMSDKNIVVSIDSGKRLPAASAKS